MRALAGVIAGCALGLAAQAATFVHLQSQPGDPTAGGAQRLEYDGARTQANGTKTYSMTVTPNAAGGVDFLQLRGNYTVRGRAGGREVSFSAPGSAETFRGAR